MKQVKLNEINHGKKIVDQAEKIWGWGTPAGEKRAIRRAALILERINADKKST